MRGETVIWGPPDTRRPEKRVLLGGSPALDKPRLSWSRLSRYLGCGRQYWYQYVADISAPSSPEMIVGSAFHFALEWAYERVLAGLPVTEQGLRDAAKIGFAWQAELRATMPEEIKRLAELAADAAVAHWRWIGCHQRPVMIEQPFLVGLGDAFPWTLYGIFDLITEDGWVRDNKLYSAFSMAKAQRGIDDDGQLTFYALAYRACFGKPAVGLAFDIVVKPRAGRGAPSRPEAEVLCTTRTDTDLSWSLGQIREVVRGIDAGVFLPNPSAWFCAKKWCSYWGGCVGARKRVQKGEAI